MGGRSIESIFTTIYQNNEWHDAESVSGPGSSLKRTCVIRDELPRFLRTFGARSLLDAPCGDFNWMQHVNLEGVHYIGGDVVPDLIEQNRRKHGNRHRTFVLLDITKDVLPRTDAILCRDCFIHFSFAHIDAAIANFKRSDCEFLLATTHVNVSVNQDITTGDWRSINLTVPPFNLPQPIGLMVENAETGKCLGLWRIADLGNT